MNVVDWFNWTTFDLIGDLVFGESFGCLDNAHTHPWIASVFGSLASLPFIQAVKSLHLTPLLTLLVPKRLQELRNANYQYIKSQIAKRINYGSDRGDFYDNVLKNGVLPDSDSEKPASDRDVVGMTQREMESNAGALVLAGSETTATLLSGTVFQLLSNPQVLAKLALEVRGAFKSEDEITVDSVNTLPYLINVLAEVMRVYPPVPALPPRKVPAGGDTVDGRFLQGGTKVHLLMYAAFRYSGNFHRANEFIPERWAGEGMFEGDKREVFFPFSTGPRNCIGKVLLLLFSPLLSIRTHTSCYLLHRPCKWK